MHLLKMLKYGDTLVFVASVAIEHVVVADKPQRLFRPMLEFLLITRGLMVCLKGVDATFDNSRGISSPRGENVSAKFV